VDPGANVIWRGDWTLNYPNGGTTPRPSVQVTASASADAEFAKYIYYGDGVNQVILPTVYSYGDTLQNILPEGHQITSEPNTGHLVSFWAQVNEWRSDQTYGWANYDIYYTVSQDNGATWSTPVNLSQENPKKAHFCPKVPEHYWNGRIWLAYGLEIHDNTDAWWDAETGQDPPLHGMPFYLYVVRLENIGVSENSHPDQTFSYRMVGKNLVLSGLPTNVKASATVYDVVGRQLMSGEGTGSLRLDMSGLATGTYLFKVDAGKFTTTGKVVVTR
ncbi:MAG: T9SS type A sorting domain-containing protein, partial [Candidatus Hydrothermia bacterium]